MTQSTQLQQDLSTENLSRDRKPRLVARCWLASDHGQKLGLAPGSYAAFRDAWMPKTYRQIHAVFDQWLPEEHRAYYNRSGTRSFSRPHTKTLIQKRAWESLKKAPKPLAMKFGRRSREWGRHHFKPVWEACEAWCRQCSTADLKQLFDQGINSRPDLESYLEKLFGHLRLA